MNGPRSSLDLPKTEWSLWTMARDVSLGGKGNCCLSIGTGRSSLENQVVMHVVSTLGFWSHAWRSALGDNRPYYRKHMGPLLMPYERRPNLQTIDSLVVVEGLKDWQAVKSAVNARVDQACHATLMLTAVTSGVCVRWIVDSGSHFREICTTGYRALQWKSNPVDGPRHGWQKNANGRQCIDDAMQACLRLGIRRSRQHVPTKP